MKMTEPTKLDHNSSGDMLLVWMALSDWNLSNIRMHIAYKTNFVVSSGSLMPVHIRDQNMIVQ
jgi:hypothetical protein